MSVWSILGISETKDKNAIKKGYLKKLAKTNPEENQEAFMELRSAYEEALRLADMEDSEDEADDKITARIRSLYDDFEKRIDAGEWQRLLDEDEFMSIATSEQAFERLMTFLMENCVLPQDVWKLICEHYDIEARMEELSEQYPSDFLEFMVANMNYSNALDLSLFEGDYEYVEDCVRKFNKYMAAVRDEEREKANELLNEIEELDLYHPYIVLARNRMEIDEIKEKYKVNDSEVIVPLEEVQPYIASGMELMEKYPDNLEIINFVGDMYNLANDLDEAKKLYEMSLALKPDDYSTKGKLAGLAYSRGEYVESRELYMDILNENNYDDNARWGVMCANLKLVELYKQQLEEHTCENEDDTRLEIAWCYFQSYQMDKAREVLESYEPTGIKLAQYYNLKGRVYMFFQENEQARECFYKWKNIIEELDPTDVSEEIEKIRKRYGYVNYLIAATSFNLSEYENARKYLDIALTIDNEEKVMSLELDCELKFQYDTPDACLDACKRLLEYDRGNYGAHLFMAKAYKQLGRINDALDEYEKAIGIYPYIAEPYEQEMRIFIDFGALKYAENVLERCRQYKIESDSIDVTAAELATEKGDFDEALRLLKAVEERRGAEKTDLDDYGVLYMGFANTYKRKGDHSAAISAYKKALELSPEHPCVYGEMALEYRNADEEGLALEALTKQLEVNPSAYWYNQRAIQNRYMGNASEAEADYKNALKIEPKNGYAMLMLGIVCEEQNRFDESESYLKSVIENSDTCSATDLRRALRALARLYMCMGRYSETEAVYEKYFELYDRDVDIMHDYAESLSRQGNIRENLDGLRAFIDENQDDEGLDKCIRIYIEICGTEGFVDEAYAVFKEYCIGKREISRNYSIMGQVFFENGRYELAEEFYKKTIELMDEPDETSYIDLIDAMLANGNKKAKKLIEKLSLDKLDMTSPYYVLDLARVCRIKGKYKKALEYCDIALSCVRCSGCYYGRCHDALLEKGMIYECMKRYALAAECYREALEICGHNKRYENMMKRVMEKV